MATRVVLIDDDEDLAFATSLALKSAGFVSETFHDCDAAAEALLAAGTDRPPSTVLMDVHLAGGMSPAAFVAWLRDHGFAAVPVVLVSAAADVAEIARRLGAAGYLRKPFKISELVAQVTRAPGG